MAPTSREILDHGQAINLPGLVAVRDSKDPDGSALIFTPDEWQTFTANVKTGDFDLA